MKQDTKDRANKTIARQLEFKSTVYGDAEKILKEVNDAAGHVSRSEKIHLKDFLPLLVEDGIKFRKGKIFSPKIKGVDLTKDSSWIGLKNNLDMALAALRDYERGLVPTPADVS